LIFKYISVGLRWSITDIRGFDLPFTHSRLRAGVSQQCAPADQSIPASQGQCIHLLIPQICCSSTTTRWGFRRPPNDKSEHLFSRAF